MSFKVIVAAAALAVAGGGGCASVLVPKEQYDREVSQLQNHIEGLKRDNDELRAQAVRGPGDGDSGPAYAEMAEALKKALADIQGIEQGDVHIGERGQVIFATDMLFDSGSWEISAKGKEVLKKWAVANQGHEFRIVGHTDRRPVVSAALKAKLQTDTNVELSSNRALAVLHEFVRAGIPERSMGIEGRGASEPRAGGDKACRRVEVFIVGGKAVMPPGVAPASRR